MLTAGVIRFAPVISAKGGIAVIRATGMPPRSISLAIVAPQRVQVPQVETRITPSTLDCLRSSAISSPSCFATEYSMLPPGNR